MKKKKKKISYVRLPKSCYGEYVSIKCTKCKRIQKIRTNDLSIYTDEIVNSFICWRCMSDKKYGLTWKERLQEKGLI